MNPRLLTGAVAFVLAGPVQASEVTLPAQMAWTAYESTGAGYVQSVGIAEALKAAYGIDLQIIPAGNDVARMAPLRDGAVEFCACGIAAYFAQEGVLLFAAPEWGPQPLRVLMTATGPMNLALATARDAGIRDMGDLKGKRISWVRDDEALNWNVAANLAFAGLTWDDVQKVEVAGFKASVDAIISGHSDAAFMTTVTPHAARLAASPRGLYWPPMPHEDEAGWARVLRVAPVYTRHVATAGAGVSPQSPHVGAAYPYPILVGSAERDAELVYNLTRGIYAQHERFSDAVPGGDGWALDNQTLTWAMPYHEGAIRFYREAGVWTAEAQANQERLVRRQQVIAQTWQAFMTDAPDLDDAGFREAWMRTRVEALEAAGLDPVFR